MATENATAVLSLPVETRFKVVGNHERRYNSYIVGSTREFYAKGDFYKTCGHPTVEAAVAKSRLDHPSQGDVWAIQECAVLVSDELAARGLRPTSPTVEVEIGQVVEIEGRHWEVCPSANKNLRFKEVL